ncbi:V-type ATP synthase beta chain [Dissostichus eleginoides]|uniref:V-type ATP synthase beta chain n=1 Tax=Dissostichus eleginoides TaxID=100907 RepID=A0AAD9BQ78_DISEL|nr:V-type ATP synthase beta chain [Dissostichus eleginoides]
MSGELYTKPGTANKVYFEPDDKESMVNIYVSAESLRVYDNPWVEAMSPNTPGPAETQHPVVLENSRKRSHLRSFSVFLCAVCLLFLAGIIGLGVQRDKDRADCSRDINQIFADIATLKKTSDLTCNITELSIDIHNLWKKYSGE